MLSDPIVALATPPGVSAVALVRVSGDEAVAVAARVVPGLDRFAERVATLARFVEQDGTPIDRGLATVFRAPRSFTGQDLVELSCHGGLATPARLVAALQAAGARPAAAGEFTRRAVLAGKLGLLEAEAIGELVESAAPRQARAALSQLEGGLRRRLDALRERAVGLQALLAYAIDFPEEDDGPLPLERLAEGHALLVEEVRRLIATAPQAARLRAGALVVLAGRPNAGKSSLFNALVGAERALVTEVPGTTRDAVEAGTTCDGWPVRLIDTAGLQDATGRLDRMGVEVSRRYLGAADVVLLCVEGSRALEGEECGIAGDARTIVVRTKGDVSGEAADDGGPAVLTSAVTGRGLDALRRAIARRAFAGADDALEPLLLRERHRDALGRALSELGEAGRHLVPRGDAVLAAHHLTAAVAALEELLGSVTTDEVLAQVFAGFCVGK
jgi:tRNA modification GTPase